MSKLPSNTANKGQLRLLENCSVDINLIVNPTKAQLKLEPKYFFAWETCIFFIETITIFNSILYCYFANFKLNNFV